MPHAQTSTVATSYAAAARAKHTPPAAWPAADLVAVAAHAVREGVSQVEAHALRVQWTAWAHTKQPVGELRGATWPALVDALEIWRAESVMDKAAAPGWAPARFDGARRADDACEAIYGLVLDCDDHGDWVRTLAALDRASLAYVAHRSATHGVDDACKWRLILPMARPATGLDRWRENYTAARIAIGAVGSCWFDPSCSNPSRLWYPPVHVAGTPRRDMVVGDGFALDLIALVDAIQGATRAPAVHTPAPSSAPPRSHVRPVATPFDRAERWLARVEGAVQGQLGDQHTFRVAAKMVRDFGLSDGDALTLMSRWNATCVPPWPAADLIAKIAHARRYGAHAEGSALDVPYPGGSDGLLSPPPPDDGSPRDDVGDPIKRRDRIRWAKLDERGNPYTCIENTQAMLDHYGVTPRRNLMTHEDEYPIPGSGFAADARANAGLAQIRDWARTHGLASTATLDDHLCLLVARNAYHPAADAIRARPWDGVDRIEALAATLMLEDESTRPLVVRVLTTFVALLAHAAMVPADADEGVASQIVLVLQGPQGKRKTRWLRSLMPDPRWFREGAVFDPKNRDSVQQATSRLLVELGELDATFRRSDVAALKAHLTNRADVYRAPYARRAESTARRTVYAATVNEAGYLHDDTGNRRFATVAVSACDPDHAIDMQQVLAQGASLPPDRCYLAADDEAAVVAKNATHEATDPMADLIASFWQRDDREFPQWERLQGIMEGIDHLRTWSVADGRAAARALRNKLGARTRVKDGYTMFACTRRDA